jgi:hypothetical protein
MLIYIAGPYRGDVTTNIANARRVAVELWEKGYNVICPHLNTSSMELDCKMPDARYLEGDLDILSRCDAMVVLPNSECSVGTQGEIAYCQNNNIPFTYYPDLPVILTVEHRNPAQCDGFRNIVMGMYRVHLVKNTDYSPANILGTGEIGLVTRLWDKVARLLNLTGFRIDIARSHFEAPANPKCESINDTLMDLAVYGVIGLLLRAGKWGR